MRAISLLEMRIDPRETLINQTKNNTTRSRFNVTTCLYFSPNNRAKSLSTLIAVDVKMDTAHKHHPKASRTRFIIKNALTSIFIKGDKISVACIGCLIRPTLRSVTARHRKKDFVGGLIEETLWREMRIRAFPRHAVMDRKMFKAERIANAPCGDYDTRTNCFSLLVMFPSPVMFAIVLGCSER